MSKKRNKCCCEKRKEECCCKPVCCCKENDSCGSGFGGSTCTPIIFLLIACGSGLLNCNKSYLIILLFILCGGSFAHLLSGNTGCNTCC